MKKIALLPFVLLASPALAHQGDHTHFDWAGLFAHVFETDHIVFAAIAAVTGVLAYRAGRRAEAKAHIKREARHDPR